MRPINGRAITGFPRRIGPPMWGGILILSIAIAPLALAVATEAAIAASSTESLSSTVLYPSRYYPDSPDSSGATPVTVRAGETSPPLILIPPPSGGTLTVRVLDEAEAPVAGILVEAVAGRFRAVALTDGEGRATVTGIPAGEVTVRSRPDDPRSETGAHALRYAPGVLDVSQADRFAIEDRQATDAGTMRLPAAARIKAAVLHSNGEPWSDLPVILRAANGASRFERRTDPSGRVTFGGLEPGGYRLWADARGTDAVTECSDGSRDTLSATPIDVVRGTLTTGIVIATDRGGEVRGAIRDLSSNDGLPGIEVRLIPVESPAAYFRFVTDAIGFYFAFGLPTGSYKIYVPAIRRWYPSSQTEDGARTIEIAEGGELDGADVRGELIEPCLLAPQSQGVIEGGVQADFDRLPGAEIIAWDGPDTFRITVNQTSIFRIACLPAGSYFVSIVPDGVYRRQYHPLTNDPAAARAVSVTAGDTTRGVNFFPELGAVLEGSVVSSVERIGIAGVPVFARGGAPGAVGCSVTDKDGLFRIDRIADDTGLPAGSWIVATDSIAVSNIETTSILAIGLTGERLGGRTRLIFLIPEVMIVHGWSLERDCGGTDSSADPIVVADSALHPDGTAAREYVEKGAPGSCRYRLTVTTARSDGEIELRSEWLEIVPAFGDPASLVPHPWNGSGSLRLPRAAAPGEGVDLYGTDGTWIARLSTDGDRAAFGEGRLPASGVYFLRYRGIDGRDHAMRMVLKR